jgi:branched-chain amino acid transport system substrate-binding protein
MTQLLMKRRSFLLRPAAAASLAAFGIQSAWAQPGVAEDAVVLGQSIALSGPFRELGNEYRAGAQLCFDQVNAGGGVAGRKIRLLSLDDGYKTDQAVANTRRLVEVENAFAIFGQFGTGITLACLPLTTQLGIPLFAPYSGADALRDDGNRYLFHVRASYGQEMRRMVDHLFTTGVKDIGIAYQGDNFGRSGLDGALNALKRHQAQPPVMGEMTITPAVEVDKAVRAISAKRPAAVILSTSGKGAVAFIKRYRETGVATQFYGMSVVSSRELAADLGPASRGIVISQVIPSPWRALVPVANEYQRLRERQGDMAAGYGSLEGFIAARVFVEGLRRAGRQLTRDKLVTALESFKDFDVGGFRVGYGAHKRTGSSFVELSMLTTDGAFVR